MPNPLQLIIVGDGACGKTSIIRSFVHNYFTEDYVPTIFAIENAVIKADHAECVHVNLIDPAGQQEYGTLRTSFYPASDVAVLCFSIDYPDSLWTAVHHWVIEIRELCPDIPILLVGNKVDLANDSEFHEFVTVQKGTETALTIGAIAYMECSAKTGQGISEVFTVAAKTGLCFKNKREQNTKNARKQLL